MKRGIFKSLLKIKMYFMSSVLGICKERSIDEIKKIIEDFDEPKDFIDRSYFQYICQKKRYKNIAYQSAFYIINILLFIPLIFFMLFINDNSVTCIDEKTNYVGCLQSKSIEDRLPDSITKNEKILFSVNNGLKLSKIEKKLIFNIWKRHPLSILFVTKCAIKIALYKGIIDMGNIKAIIATSEDSYTSSVLTEYCHIVGVEHINIMHGEIVVNLARTFFEFDKCYVWDEYYAKLCVEMRAAKGQFIIETPPCLLYNGNYAIKHKIKYYLQDHTKSQLKVVKRYLDGFNMDYKVRPHPIFGKLEDVKAVFDEGHIENYNNVSIEHSIMESEILIAWDSTTLFQGYLNGKKILIDDISNKDRYRYLCENGYILCEKDDVGRLSEINKKS